MAIDRRSRDRSRRSASAPAAPPRASFGIRFLAPIVAGLLALGLVAPAAQSAESTDLEARVAELERQVAALCAASVDTCLAPAPTRGGLRPDRYGPGVGFTSKGNIRIGPNTLTRVGQRLVASASDVVSIGLQIRLGATAGYSGGSGGDWLYGIQADAGGLPSGQWLGAASYATGQSSGPYTRYFHLPVTARVAPGQPFWVVVEDADPSSFASLNLAYSSRGNLQPAFTDDVYVRVYRSGAWTIDGGSGVGSMSRYTPVVDVTYADGTHDGAQFHEAMAAQARSVGGAASVRERFTAARTMTVTGAGVFMDSGAPARLELRDAAGKVLAATGTPSLTDGFHRASFATPVTMTAGRDYSLVVTGGSGTVRPARAIGDEDSAFYGGTGTRSGPWRSYGFMEGVGEYTTGGAWSPMYADSPQHLMCYLEVAP